MSELRVLAYFNSKQCQFSIEALEGDNKDRVVAQVNSLVLRNCKFSKNKDKTAGIIGMWDNTQNRNSSDLGAAIKKYLGNEENYVAESITYNTALGKYIRDDLPDLIGDSVLPEVISQIEDDISLKQSAIDNAVMIYLEVEEDDSEDANDILGVAFYCRSKSSRVDPGKINEPREGDSSYFADMDMDSCEKVDQFKQCPECNGDGFICYPCDECDGNPDQIGGTGCSKCGGDGIIELKCPMCNGGDNL